MTYDHWKTTDPRDAEIDDAYEARLAAQEQEPEAHTPGVFTVYDPPAIPIRNYDWCAYREGQEEAGPYGYGVTRAEAIADLLILEEEGW